MSVERGELYLPEIGYLIGTKETIERLSAFWEQWQRTGVRRTAQIHPSKPMPVYPVMDSLQDVINLAESKLPIMDKNTLVSLFGSYHNTLLAQVQATHKG